MVTILPMWNKNFPGDPEEPHEVFGADEGTQKSFTLTILENLANLVKNYPGNIVRQHHTDQKQIGLLKEQCAEWKNGHLRFCCNQVWMNNWWVDSTECYCYLRNIQGLLSEWNTPYEGRFGIPFKGPVIPFGAMVEYHPISAKDLSRLQQFGPKVFPGIFPWICIERGGNLERRHSSSTHWRIGGDGRIWTPRPKAQCKGSVNPMRGEHFHIPSRSWNSQNFWRRTASENIHLNPGSSGTRRRRGNSSRKIRRITFSISTTRWLNTRCGS